MKVLFCVQKSLVFLVYMRFVFPSAPEMLAAESKADGNVHLMVSVERDVTVKRKGWSNYAPVVFGTELQPGDLLRVGEHSRAKIVCSDLTLHDISAGLTGVPCEKPRGVLVHRESIINETRGWQGTGSFPQVLSPRKTKLLSPTPVLRWTPVAEATRYRVIVRGGGLLWTDQVYSSTEIIYPNSAPQLRPGVDYKLTVESDGRTSSEPGLGLGFSLLAPKDKSRVLQERKQIESLGLPEGSTQFLIAYLYASFDLRAEAIEKLELIAQKFKVAAVPKLLGDLYASIGLIRQSEANYLNALELAKNEDDEIGLMTIHLALARIYQQTLSNPKAAVEHFDSVLIVANRLGDSLTAVEARERLAELRNIGTR